MKKVIFSLLLAAGFSYAADAQQDATYNMYMFNGLYINPAYAGSQDVLNVMGIFRDQWAGLDGAPRTVNASIDAPLRRDQYALGLTIMNDRLGLTNDFSVTGAFAYRIRLGKDNILALGMQFGATYYQQRNAEATIYDNQNNYDPAFTVNQNLWMPNIGAGAYLYGKRYFVGFSVPHLVPWSEGSKWAISTNQAVAHQYNQYLVTAGYVFGKDASIVKFRPSFLLKEQAGPNYNMPDFSFDAGLLFIDRVWLILGINTGSTTAIGTRQEFGATGILGIIQAKLTPQLGIGYSYEYSLTALRAYETGTHEIMINYLFWYNKKRFVTPRYVKYF